MSFINFLNENQTKTIEKHGIKHKMIVTDFDLKDSRYDLIKLAEPFMNARRYPGINGMINKKNDMLFWTDIQDYQQELGE